MEGKEGGFGGNTTLAQSPRLEPGDFGELVKVLRKVTHTNEH